jgi:hypothetical protein
MRCFHQLASSQFLTRRREDSDQRVYSKKKEANQQKTALFGEDIRCFFPFFFLFTQYNFARLEIRCAVFPHLDCPALRFQKDFSSSAKSLPFVDTSNVQNFFLTYRSEISPNFLNSLKGTIDVT